MKKFKHNGRFAILLRPYDKGQHSNQQCGLDKYVDVLDFHSGVVNSVKLYENTNGLHFKKGGSHYLDDFTTDCVITPYIVKSEGGEVLSCDGRLIGLVEGG